MLPDHLRQDILALVRQQVVPAIGCTEPICVALATARATERLGTLPARIKARLSPNILKNAMGVGIPGTGMVGLPIAIALGALVGRSAYGLEVLRDSTPADVEAGKRFIDEGRIAIALAHDTTEKLYVEVTVSDETGREERATIAREHTKFVDCDSSFGTEPPSENCPLTPHVSDAGSGGNEQQSHDSDIGARLNLRMVYDFATTSPIEELAFINEAGTINMQASALSLKGNYGHSLGKVLTRPLGRGIMGDNIFSHILSATSSACDARMAGAMIPVMSNSGSGNQGICATNPVMVFAGENHNTDEELTRALMLSHLTAIYIKQHLGTLSALCGCVVASTGSACGITLLMGGNYDHVAAAVKNMIANLTGMICDGAKPSCALKLTSGVSTAVLSAMLAMQGECVSSVEGIIDDCVDKSIRNLAEIGKNAMNETDRKVLDIMTSK
ncbi:serine dehydratase subunit alpha family protein [Alloprevotella sp. OH1205_COT-284]|uniref:L-cysteine desulfidase family protein n=1 Tax=Alloprevotella sp. OH1205_COT-284 TaxID=2491043 RepID=UPI000F6013D2|nr:L-serine ammonia-lyase, iron-sulfur-dependent, subunit alpha [Alloprevotella sp. OH1205_COT-284]RRD79910.1 serine dehydratase subunit alpha family protein [Alloprevotella sp. OH1205_COT-284]